MLHPWLLKLAALFRRRGDNLSAGLREELETHLELETQDNVERGLTAAQAREAAAQFWKSDTAARRRTRRVALASCGCVDARFPSGRPRTPAASRAGRYCYSCACPRHQCLHDDFFHSRCGIDSRSALPRFTSIARGLSSTRRQPVDGSTYFP